MPSSAAVSATTNADLIGVWHRYIDALDAPLAEELAIRAVGVQPAGLSHYCYEEGRLSVEQIMDPTFPLRNISGSRVKTLVCRHVCSHKTVTLRGSL